MYYRFLLISVFAFFIILNVDAQEAVKETKTKASPEPVIKEESNKKIFEAPSPIPDVNAKEEKGLMEEEEILEESPLKGEPVIGAEIFEEQSPAQPIQNKKQENKPKNEKEIKPDGFIEE